ncbi:MAG TPA: hypothetical protein VFN67_09765 [Polyangiales bacterium]|jgi:hypothetical protein|nr:hypothetical protein [Polyangiales bacterium]
MKKLRHILALSALGMIGCVSESPWEPVLDWNGVSALFGDAPRTLDDAGADAADGGSFRGAHEGGDRACTDVADSGSLEDAAEHTDDEAAHSVDWSTPTVQLTSDDFRIAVGGKAFLGHAADAGLNSDPGRPDAYTTLERIWTEHGVEMRLFMYFYSDGTDWWSSEIRIYDGEANAEWLAAIGEWFRRPLGQSFEGDLDLTLGVPPWSAEKPGNRGPGRLTMRGLVLQAFAAP